MDTAVGIDNVTHLTHFELECRVLKWLLHLASRKEAQVTLSAVRRAVGLRGSWVMDRDKEIHDVMSLSLVERQVPEGER